MVLKLSVQARRKARFIAKHPFCTECETAGGSASNPLTIDHVVPLSRGGARGQSNWQVLCRRCNLKKGARMPTAAASPDSKDLPAGERLLQRTVGRVRKLSLSKSKRKHPELPSDVGALLALIAKANR